LKIPDSDIFEIVNLNELYEKDCSKLLDQGSYIVLIKRKEIMQFNSKFMIKVAEGKGIFGDSSRKFEIPENLKQINLTEPSHTNRKRRKSNKVDLVIHILNQLSTFYL
jgi:hypothetical protein